MAGEIQLPNGPPPGSAVYANVRSTLSGNMIWNNVGSAFVNYSSASFANYAISMTLQQQSGNFWVGNFPSSIAPGLYSIIANQQQGGSPAESDRYLGGQDFNWNGSYPTPLSDVVTSGQFGTSFPLRLATGVAVSAFPFYLVSAGDGITPFVSGICSGSISRDNGAFLPLQSGSFTEIGQGGYSVPLTSGDLLCNSALLLFNANGVSGGVAVQRAFSLLLQPVSGSYLSGGF
jgi:hypothetical protein